MRIITPSGGAFSPSGADSGEQVVGTFSVSLNVSADFTVPSFSICTLPSDGHYQFVAALTFKNGTADAPPATFVAEFLYYDGDNNPIGPATFFGLTGGLDQAYLVAAVPPVEFLSQAGSAVKINYGATGITGGSVDVTINVVVTKLA